MSESPTSPPPPVTTGAATVAPAAPPPPVSPPAAASHARNYVYRGEGESWYQPILWDSGRLISQLLSLLLFRLRVFGVENVPKRGPALLVTNHQSFLDPWLIGIAVLRQIHFMARDTLFKGGFLGWLNETLNAFPVKRGQGDRAAIRTAAERLDRGFIVNIFPEGTRSLDGPIGPIAPGMALIIRGCKRPVPVIAVVIDGAFEAWPRTRKLPRPHPIRIIYGKPITPEEIKTMSPDELAARVRRDLVELQAKVGSVHAEASARRITNPR